MNRDVIVDQARRIRDMLVSQHGGLNGWFDHLQAIDRERRRNTKKPASKKRATKRVATSR